MTGVWRLERKPIEPVAALALEIDGERDPLPDLGVGVEHQGLDAVQGPVLGDREAGVADAEAHLAEARAGAHPDREGARADLEIERALVAGRQRVEAAGAVADHAGEDVEPARSSSWGWRRR